MSVTRRERTQKIAGIAMLSAIVVVLQLLGSFIRFSGFSVSLVLVPIVIGSAMYGIGAGTWLGFVFGVTVLISGDASPFLAINVPGTIVTVLLKGTLAGLISDLIYNLLSKYNKTLAVFVSAILCPVVNTGVFILGCKFFFLDAIKTTMLPQDVETFLETISFPAFIENWIASSGNLLLIFFVFGLGLINFIPELIFNIAMSPTIVKLIDISTSKFKFRK